MQQSSILFELLRAGILDCQPQISQDMSIDWEALMSNASNHNILAWVWDGICKLPLEQQPPRQQRINWGLSAQEVWDAYYRRKKIIDEMVSVCNDNSVRLMILKGIGVSEIYPKPQSRPSGDIDIYLFDNFEKGKELFGEEVLEGTALHDEYHYKGILVENHKMFIYPNTPVKKLVGTHLLNSLDKVILSPNGYYTFAPMDNLAYLMMHAFNHIRFISDDGLYSLKSIVDLVIFFNTYRKTFSPNEVLSLMQKLGLAKPFELVVYFTEWLLKVECAEFHQNLIPEDDMRVIYDLFINKGLTIVIQDEGSFFYKSKRLWNRYNKYMIIYHYLPRHRTNIFIVTMKEQLSMLRNSLVVRRK